MAFESADDEQGQAGLELVVGVKEMVQALGGVHAAGGEHEVLSGNEAVFFGEERVRDGGGGIDAVGNEFDGGFGAGLDFGDLGARDGGQRGAGVDEGGFGEAQEALGEAAPLGALVGVAVERAEQRQARPEEAQDPGEGTEGRVVDVGEVGPQHQRAVQRAQDEKRRGAAVLALQGGDGNDADVGREIEGARLGGGADDIDVVAVAGSGGKMEQDVFGDAVGTGEGGKGFAAEDGDLHGFTCS